MIYKSLPLFLLVSKAIALTVDLDAYLSPAVAYAEKEIESAITTNSGVGNTNIATATIIAGNLKAALSTGVGGTSSDWCPNYQYTWLRDQALTMSTIIDKYEIAAAGSAESKKYEEILMAYAAHADTVYEKNGDPIWFTSSGRPWSQAEAKYELNGQMYLGGWCSPQNDGPALRAVVLMRFANRYQALHPSDTTYVSQNLYSTNLAKGVKNPIKRDLEYLYQPPQKVASNPDRYTGNWDSENCEPWEEVSGKHFYDRLMARRAMVMGSAFAAAHGDSTGANNYNSIVGAISSAVDSHWDSSLQTMKPTIGGSRYEDIQTVFATLHSHPEADGYYGPTYNRVLANAYYTLSAFSGTYNLNAIGYKNSPLTLGLALGRYLGDVYNGGCTYSSDVCPSPCGGQPWFLATNTMAELIFKAVDIWKTSSIVIDSTNIKFFQYFNIKNGAGTYAVGSSEHSDMLIVLIHAADSFLARTEYHTDSNYRLDEQYNADTGKMMSAGDLVWSYASLVTANDIRKTVNPASTIAGLASNGMIKQEFIISDYDLTYDSSKPVYRISGNVAALGSWDPCSSGFQNRTPSVRRCRDGKCDYSILISVPMNTQIEYKMVRTDASCTKFEWSIAGNTTIAATNNGQYASSASWTRTA